MRPRVLTFVCVIFLAAAAAASAAPGQAPSQPALRAEAAVLPPADPVAGSRAGAWRTSDDLRDSAALVLVGSMLLGLAAAVRRTA